MPFKRMVVYLSVFLGESELQRNFNAELKNLWFYGDDLTQFASNLEKLIDNNITKASLEAMSDFR